MTPLRTGALLSLAVWASSLTFTSAPPAAKSPKAFTDTLTGRRLAMQYCQRCHLFPEPALLDKDTWKNSILPNMGLRLGIRSGGADPYSDLLPEEAPLVREMNIYPDTPQLPQQEWESIAAYYQQAAPEKPLPQKKTAEPIPLSLFQASTLTVGGNSVPKTTMLKWDAKNSRLYIGDDQNALYAVDSAFKLIDQWWVDSAPTDIDVNANVPLLLTIGKFAPSDQKLGRLMSISKGKTSGPIVNIQNLPRPVHFTVSDLNLDGKPDPVISGFGNHSGKLFWFDGFDPAKEHVLKALPGARKTEIRDLNKDKKPDVIALMSQAWEGISIFYNQGNGKFTEKSVLQFPPSYGVNYFEMLDFNGDGFEDILLTNGDNWDLSPVKKNYHGIRIFLNDKKNNFKQTFFYPLYGASKAVARDFDNDGDLDIAAISFYTDLENAAEGFVLLSNEGKMNFKPQITPEAALGKWLVMEAGDFDQDGDIDIVLGSYFHTLGEMTKLMSRGVLTFPQLLVLKNTKK